MKTAISKVELSYAHNNTIEKKIVKLFEILILQGDIRDMQYHAFNMYS